MQEFLEEPLINLLVIFLRRLSMALIEIIPSEIPGGFFIEKLEELLISFLKKSMENLLRIPWIIFESNP